MIFVLTLSATFFLKLQKMHGKFHFKKMLNCLKVGRFQYSHNPTLLVAAGFNRPGNEYCKSRILLPPEMLVCWGPPTFCTHDIFVCWGSLTFCTHNNLSSSTSADACRSSVHLWNFRMHIIIVEKRPRTKHCNPSKLFWAIHFRYS